MKKIIVKLMVLSLFATSLMLSLTVSHSSAAQGQDVPSLEGAYHAELALSGVKLRLGLEISKSPDGAYSGKVRSIDQGNAAIPITAITYKDGNVKLELNTVQAVFEGAINKDGSEITGQFKQGGLTSPLVFKRGEAAARSRPQNPKKPYPYDEEEVVYQNKKGGITLAGTLTLPRGKTQVPAVVLLTGSGLQDRDETLAGHKPFLVLADHLTRRGIAVLRVDDRGAGGSTGNISTSTGEDFAGDALAGVEFLKSRKEINPKQIGLIGHSEGGIVAPLAASKSADVAFIVMMAGTGLVGEEILYLQGQLILKAAGASPDALAKQRAIQERTFAILKEEKDNQVAGKRLREEAEKLLADMTDEQKKAIGLSKEVMDAHFAMALTPWFRYFLVYDPRPALKRVKVPVLAINGERDLQVPYKENLQAIEESLKAGGNKNYTTMSLPGLNHLFQTSQTGGISEYEQIEETISPVALNAISDWILKQTARK